MNAFLHAAWFHDHDGDDAALDAALRTHLDRLAGYADVGRHAAYTVDPGGPDIQWVKSTVAHLEDHPVAASPAAAFVIAEVGEMTTALSLAEALGTPDGPGDAATPSSGAIAQALLQEIAYVPGPDEDTRGGFGAAVQLGSFSVKTVPDEWRLSGWYEFTRHPEVGAIPGTIRTRRYVSIAGHAKFGILYEFTSLEARIEGFERPMEGNFQNPAHPTAQLGQYTVHAPGAPYIGQQRSV